MRIRKAVPEEITVRKESLPEAEVELSVSVSIGRRNSKGDFRNITIRSGELRPCELDEISNAHDAAWDSIKSKIRKRFPQAVKVAIEMEDE